MKITVIVTIFDRIELLPFFLTHYNQLGADQFVLCLWNGIRNPLYKDVKNAIDEWWDVHIRPSVICPIEQYNGPAETPGVNLVRQEFCDDGDWYSPCDLDEFYWFGGRTFREVIPEIEEAGCAAIHGQIFDRVGSGGSLPSLEGITSLDDAFPVECRLTASLGPKTNINKIALAKSFVPIDASHRSAGTFPTRMNGCIAYHFKWTDGLQERLAKRHKNYSMQGLDWAWESSALASAFNPNLDLTNLALMANKAQRIGV